MTTYKIFGPDAEVFGGAMLAFVQSINYQNFKTVLERHGVKDIDPNTWYPQQMWLDIFSDISRTPDASSNLVSIGIKIAETAPVPPQVQALPFQQIMLGFNDGSYLANNRGKDIGYIETQIIDDQHILMVDKTPYPADFVYGAYYGMARRFLPKGTDFTVKFDADVPTREKGGDATLVHIMWK